VRLYVGGLIVLLCACAHKKKKWLFAVTEKGTKAKANNIEPSVYLSEKFTRLSSASCVEDILTFLPWNAAKKVR
jgi:hypothetical protein